MVRATLQKLKGNSLLKIFSLAFGVSLLSVALAIFIVLNTVAHKSKDFKNAYYKDLLSVLTHDYDIDKNVEIFKKNFQHFRLDEQPVAIFNSKLEVVWSTPSFKKEEINILELEEISKEKAILSNRYNYLEVYFQSRHYLKNPLTKLITVYVDNKNTGIAGFLQLTLLLFFISTSLCIFISLFFFIKKMKDKAIEVESIITNLESLHQKYVHEDLMDRFTRIPEVINSLLDKLYKTIEERDKIAESRFELLSQLTHDIRTPLTSIKTSTDTLYSNAEINKEQKDVLRSIVSQDIDYLSKLVDDLLFLAILDRRKEEAQEIQPISSLLTSLKEKYINSRGELEIKIEFREDDLKDIKLSELEFLRLVNNIFSNGLKYSKSYFIFKSTISDNKLKFSMENDFDEIDKNSIISFGKKKSKRKIDLKNKQSSIGLGSVIISSIIRKWNGSLKFNIDEKLNIFFMEIEIPINQ